MNAKRRDAARRRQGEPKEYAIGNIDKMTIERVRHDGKKMITMECHANFVNEKPIVSIQTELYNRESGKFLTGSDSEEQGHVGEPGDITINDHPLIRFSGLLNQPGWFLLLYKDESFLLKPCIEY